MFMSLELNYNPEKIMFSFEVCAHKIDRRNASLLLLKGFINHFLIFPFALHI